MAQTKNRNAKAGRKAVAPSPPQLGNAETAAKRDERALVDSARSMSRILTADKPALGEAGPLSVELRKLLADKSAGALLPRVFGAFGLPAVETAAPLTQEKWYRAHMQNRSGVDVAETIDMSSVFDVPSEVKAIASSDGRPVRLLELDEWLGQVILIAGGEQVTIGEVVTYVANTRGAHAESNMARHELKAGFVLDYHFNPEYAMSLIYGISDIVLSAVTADERFRKIAPDFIPHKKVSARRFVDRKDGGTTIRTVPNPRNRMKVLRQWAKSGNAPAQYELARTLVGDALTKSMGAKKNMKEGMKWYRSSAKQGHMWAQCGLAMVLFFRLKEYKGAVFWASQVAANQKVPPILKRDVQFALGVASAEGRGVPQDYAEAARWFRFAAEQGHVKAQANLGWLYHNGLGVARNDEAAAKWFYCAIEQGHIEAQIHLRRIAKQEDFQVRVNLDAMHRYCGGAGIEPNDRETTKRLHRAVERERAEAQAYLRHIAEQGGVQAQINLGAMYHKGVGVARNDGEAVKWWRRAAGQGHVETQVNLGAMYYKGVGVARNDEEAMKWTRLAAEQGHAQAQFNFGAMCHKGEGVEQNDEEAAKWIRLAAEQGHAQAQSNLGAMYHDGIGVARDYGEAVKWTRLAAEQRHAQAQSNLGWTYHSGVGVARDDGEAVKWWHLAAEQGFASAQNNLGVAYRRGEGVPRDYGEAAKFFRLAAEQGLASAQNNLGLMHKKGEGVPRDYGEAMKWTRLAAEQGDAEAQHNLGVMYHNGEGVPRNRWEAYVWYSLAAANGHKKAAKCRDSDARKLSPADLSSADEEVARRRAEFAGTAAPDVG